MRYSEMNRGRYAINLYDIMTLLTGYGYSTLSAVATTYEKYASYKCYYYNRRCTLRVHFDRNYDV